MKVRFGFTIGPEIDAASFGPLVDDLERLRFDSVWVPEVLQQPTLDPIVALSHAAARTTRLKLGSHLILPGRHPVQLARQLAHLDQLSGGRLLLLGVLGIVEEAESGAQGVHRADRTSVLDEMVPLLRRLWRGEVVDHSGRHFELAGVQVTPAPVQDPLELWLGGQVPAALRRCGRMGDGWMPGLVHPHEAAAMRGAIEDAAAEAGRVVDAEHFGANLFYATAALPDEARRRLESRRRDGDASGMVPIGMPALRDRAHEWIEAGFSKFLLRPLVPPADRRDELEMLAADILPLTT